MIVMARPRVRTAEVRDRALSCAIDVLEREGPPAVSARRIAAAAGTSTAALYEFFGDKAGLVRAVFFEGFAALQSALEAIPQRGDGRQYLVDLLDESRRFALARPMLFEVMTSRPFAEFSPDDQDTEAGVAIYRLIVGAVRRWLNEVESSYDAREAAHIIVAAHRGFVASELAGLAGSSPRTITARYRRGIDALLGGIQGAGTS
jgi:AcrR family transcriptional regulator